MHGTMINLRTVCGSTVETLFWVVKHVLWEEPVDFATKHFNQYAQIYFRRMSEQSIPIQKLKKSFKMVLLRTNTFWQRKPFLEYVMFIFELLPKTRSYFERGTTMCRSFVLCLLYSTSKYKSLEINLLYFLNLIVCIKNYHLLQHKAHVECTPINDCTPIFCIITLFLRTQKDKSRIL